MVDQMVDDKFADIRKSVGNFRLALKQIGRSEKTKHPTVQFGQEYNKLREMILAQVPNDSQGYVPPMLSFVKVGSMQFSDTRYAELEAYFENLADLIPAKPYSIDELFPDLNQAPLQ